MTYPTSNQVKIISKVDSSASKMAIKMLNKTSISYLEIIIGETDDISEYFRTNNVPNPIHFPLVFVDDLYIGGLRELQSAIISILR